MNSESSDIKYRVNGELLSKYVGKEVIVLGTVSKVNPDGRQWELEASDRQHIVIGMKRPLDEQLSGIVEVHGTAQSSNSVLCDSYIPFSSDMTQGFEMEMYNEVLKVANITQNPLVVEMD